ncbi:tRNA pseudouridine(55) synthase TruB [Arenicella sp. 4NH20-0111]|uniref:tRNA pseudouridine(55) synthase TruB n=1 Tax=Arenicella sp. 4NH20-0111 TaxID=3127648 RepID=UPI00310A7481
MAQYKNKKNQIHGVLLLDKPLGLSSNAALQKVKWLYQAKKAGHTGALDPLATGLLPICFGQATKVSEYLLGSSKKYTTTIKLGEVTDTRDAEGVVIDKIAVDVSDAQIEEVLSQFRGQIKQVPPMYSALKKDGQPLYKLARKGKEIELPARDMTVYSLAAERTSDVLLKLEVHCSSGFYIRSLGHDIGQALGCGAHVVELRRTDIKSISVRQSHSIEALTDLENDQQALTDLLLPIDVLISDMPQLQVSDKQIKSLLCGKPTQSDGLVTSGLTRFYRPNGGLFALGEVRQNSQIKTQKIFVDID